MKASDVMVTNVITVGPNASVREAANVLLANRISALPVIDEHGELVEIISEGDLMGSRRIGDRTAPLLVARDTCRQRQGNPRHRVHESACAQGRGYHDTRRYHRTAGGAAWRHRRPA